MTRFGIDALTAVRLVREGITVHDEHNLVGPNLLRSQALSLIYREVRRGELGADEARTMLDRLTTMRIRLLGDRVSRATAWKVAEQLGWDDTANAEYVAVANCRRMPSSPSTRTSPARSRALSRRRRSRRSSVPDDDWLRSLTCRAQRLRTISPDGRRARPRTPPQPNPGVSHRGRPRT